MSVTEPATNPPELWLQTLRFWRCARTVRHGVIDPATNLRKQMTKQEKLEEIEYWSQAPNQRRAITKRYDELRAEANGGKEYQSNESAEIKTAS